MTAISNMAEIVKRSALVHEDCKVNVNKSYFCPFVDCYMTFDRPSRLQWHLCRHTGEKPYKCEIVGCEKAYATTTKLKRHQKTAHSKKNLQHIDGASEGLLTSAEASQAPPNNHGAAGESSAANSNSCESVNVDYKFKCLEAGCGKSFKRRTNLYNHKVLQHEKRANYSCSVEGCNKVFAFPNLLKRHMKSHDGYTCKHCPSVFTKWTDMRKHVSSEHKTVHACSQCSKTFKRPCDLKRHELTHSGSKQVYECTAEGCEKKYDRVSTLRKHIKAQHHGELPFKCHQCVAAFPHAADLKRHVKYHEKASSSVKKSYPAKGHRKVSLVARLLGPMPDSFPVVEPLPPVILSQTTSSSTPGDAFSADKPAGDAPRVTALAGDESWATAPAGDASRATAPVRDASRATKPARDASRATSLTDNHVVALDKIILSTSTLTDCGACTSTSAMFSRQSALTDSIPAACVAHASRLPAEELCSVNA